MPPENNDNDDLKTNGPADTGAEGEQSAQSGTTVAAAQDTDQGDATGTTPKGHKPEGESGKEAAPKSALEAVLKVVGDKRDAAEKDQADLEAGKATAGKDAKPDEKAEETDLTAGKIDEAEWKALPARTRQRITQFRAKVKEQGETITAMTPKAQTYDELVTWTKTHGLTPDDFSEGLEIMRLVKQDPVAAYERLQPILKQLQEHVGEVLPADLKAEFDDGKITEARAKELARSRKEQERLSQQNVQRTEADQERRAQDEAKRFADSVTRSVKEWETSWKTSDPDYKRKAPRVWERMQTLLAAEKEITPEKAVEIAKKARKEIEDWMAELAPPRKGKEPVPQGGSGPTTKKPASALEAAKLALQA